MKGFFSKGILCLLMVGLVLVLSGCREREHAWPELKDPELGFKVTFPRHLENSDKKIRESVTNQGRFRQFLYTQKHLAFYFSVSVVEFPAVLREESEVVDPLDNAVMNLTRQYRATMESNMPVIKGNVPGRTFRAVLPQVNHETGEKELMNENVLSGMVFIRGNRVYQILTVGLGNAQMTRRFFESFQFI